MKTRTQCEIYEFSRKLLEPRWSRRHDRYVSTGFDREIGHENREVPHEIVNAVYNNAFRINDSYPPPAGEIALMAREMGKYAVLAVATGLIDDSDRPLIGYRYFWLEKPADDEGVDGIGTLLAWWLDRKSPCFQLQPSSYYKNAFKNDSFVSLDRNNYIQEYCTDSVDNYLQEISIQQNLENVNFPDCREFHTLALLLRQKYSLPLHWAFQVSQLECPEQFSLIHSKVNGRERLTVKLDRFSRSFSNVSESLSNPSQIKRCLLELARNKDVDRNLQKLVTYLSASDSYHWDWQSIIDKTALKGYNLTSARYRALLAILKPVPEIFTWLDWLRRKRGNKRLWRAGISLQNQLIEACKSSSSTEINFIDNRFDDIIDALLISEKYKNIPIFFQEKQWLLTRSKSFWVDCFYDSADYYLSELLARLDDGKSSENYPLDRLRKKILDSSTEQPLSKRERARYESLARLFARIKSYDLAALFYQFSRGEVPAYIYRRVKFPFIELKKSSRFFSSIALALDGLKHDISLLLDKLTRT
ncbi:hypothetical protein V0288_04760 [Pannus brasiliensis CCIBt3594]|uniref:Uncharacterized protein n=1 Tax=Pannus brasiliensis CCIBt3594 TaxID=1427578 RepID=A0AAW9QQD4_9CHRO